VPIKAVDFFSGCGGTSAGLRAAGVDIRMAIDNDVDAVRTYRANMGDRVAVIDQDIRTIRPQDVEPALTDLTHDDVILFSACAPCQPFSRQKRNSSARDDRFSLLLEFVRFVWYFKPDLIFLENVPGVDRANGAMRPFATCLDSLRSLGYHVEYGIVDCRDYGVPQRRRRLILMGSRMGKIKFPPHTHGPGTPHERYSTVRDWIADLPPLSAGENCPWLPNHRAAHLSELNLRRIQATPAEGTRRQWSEELVLKCHQNGHKGHTDVYGRLRWDEPSSGITTRCISLSNGRFGHPEQDRALSAREAACLQTFPLDFTFQGSMASVARQIGNAVPFLLSQRFGEEYIRHVARIAQGGE
jgi:DNA (cytosine-5)-methyltransferase 1